MPQRYVYPTVSGSCIRDLAMYHRTTNKHVQTDCFNLSLKLICLATGERLADFYIRVGQTFSTTDQGSFNPNTYTLCHYQSTAVGEGETRKFECDDPVGGRYVTVHFPQSGAERLTLCEVAVFITGLCIILLVTKEF